MPYTPTQDGTQAFAIPASPITINSVAYILEDVDIQSDSANPVIRDANGIPSGQAIVPDRATLSGTLQLATVNTVVPSVGQSFTAYGSTWLVKSVGTAYKQGDYTKVKLSAVYKIN